MTRSRPPVETAHKQLIDQIRTISDWPKPGVQFKDITPLLRDPAALALAVELMSNRFRGKGVDIVAGAESRGFIFGTAVATQLSAGFVPIRKPGKLPHDVHTETYELEYGTDSLEIHRDAIGKGQNVLLVDDVLATGGTMSACCKLVETLGGAVMGVSVLIELDFLNGREKIGFDPIHSVLRFGPDD